MNNIEHFNDAVDDFELEVLTLDNQVIDSVHNNEVNLDDLGVSSFLEEFDLKS